MSNFEYRIIPRSGTCAAVEAHPFEPEGRIFRLSLSIGLIEIDGTLATGGLLSKADAAMYRAKGQGKNRFCTLVRRREVRFRLFKLRLSLAMIRVFTLLWDSGVSRTIVKGSEQCEAHGSVIPNVRRSRT